MTVFSLNEHTCKSQLCNDIASVLQRQILDEEKLITYITKYIYRKAELYLF